MHIIDWLIVAGSLIAMIGVALLTRSLMRSVADFLAANRLAGRYLVSVADGMAGLGAISIAASFEKFYEAGFGAYWWGQMLAPIGLILVLSGFVIYRYRETRVFTMAQFFEVRYSKRFRVFAGFLAFASGILNYGIFPAVTGRFLIYFAGLPVYTWTVPGIGIELNLTLGVVMAILLSLAVALTLSGGQIAVIITDFVQGQFSQITILIVIAVLFYHIGWSGLIDGLSDAPANASRLDPFDQGGVKGFDPYFFLMMATLSIYGFKAWQGNQGYNAAPKSPHEARMAGILGQFRGQVMFLIMNLIPLLIYAMMHLPEFSEQTQATQQILSTIDNAQYQTQTRVPIGLSQILPVGVMGMFAALIIAAAVSTDDTYLHSWGSIFIQDVVLPLRGKPLSQKAHLMLLRLSIAGVAIFAWLFSMLFPLNEYIFMYFQITGAIYLGGAGAVILGGLYWKRGTVEGAWAAMIIGSILAISSIVLRNIIWPYVLPAWRESADPSSWVHALPEQLPLNGVHMSIIVAMCAVTSYVVFSLLSRRPPVNMDKLLHRGKYAVESEGHHPDTPADIEDIAATPAPVGTWRERMWRRLGVNADFTPRDKFIFVFQFCFGMFFFAVFSLGMILRLFWDIPVSAWIGWWGFMVVLAITMGIIGTVWFVIGGVHDLIDIVRTLRGLERHAEDDGTVREDEHLQETH